MIRALLLLLAALPLAAADGLVVNQTTGKPQAGATVTLFKMGGPSGPEVVESVKSGPDGKWSIAAQPAPGPHMIQTAFDGVTYNLMLPPGRPMTGIPVAVYNSSPKPGSARAVHHMVLLEPRDSKLSVRESYFFLNDGNTTWNNDKDGTLRFRLPGEPEGRIEMNVTAPQGMPIRRAADKAGPENTWKLDFPIKPGETRIDLAYTLPDATSFKTKLITPAEQTMIAAPNGVTVTGAGLVDKGKEPRTQATIYEVETRDLDLKLEGTGDLTPPAAESESQGPSISQVNPRMYDRLYVVLGLAFAIMALGLLLLYRAQEPKR